jgi:hypothetical protein
MLLKVFAGKSYQPAMVSGQPHSAGMLVIGPFRLRPWIGGSVLMARTCDCFTQERNSMGGCQRTQLAQWWQPLRVMSSLLHD